MAANEQEPGESALDNPGESMPAGPGPVAEACEAVPPVDPSALEALLAGVDALNQQFESKIRYDAGKDRLIDSLHQTLQQHREDLHFKILRPLFMDLIALHDDLGKLAGPPPEAAQAEAEEERLRGGLASFIDTVEEILARNGVGAFNEDGDSVVQQRQRVVATVPTFDADLDLRVAERRRKGFAYEGKILRPELVATYRYTGETPPKASEEDS